MSVLRCSRLSVLNESLSPAIEAVGLVNKSCSQFNNKMANLHSSVFNFARMCFEDTKTRKERLERLPEKLIKIASSFQIVCYHERIPRDSDS